MTDICFIFEVHQPLRLNRNFHPSLFAGKNISEKDLFNLYFDNDLNRKIFERTCQKCYFPANDIILENIDRYKREKRRFKVAYSLSGIFVEQCQHWKPSLLESFRRLAETGCVEFLCQTYYHSLSSLFGLDRTEFIEQVNMHHQLVQKLFKQSPQTFENTECLYNNSIAKTIESLGFRAIITESVAKVLQWRSPNYVYKAKNSEIRVLLRNYRLSDDIGFRFTSRWWSEWPLTAEKYSSWLAATPGQLITIFMDYETFGEHHWPESGIHEFLRWLPGEILKWHHLSFITPSEAVEKHQPVGEIDVGDFETISWADLERDTSAWLGNPMQLTCYESLKSLEELVKDTEDPELVRIWRYLQSSDHLYYISTKGAGPGDVHSYFNPYNSAVEAFTVFSRILSDFENRVMRKFQTPRLIVKRILRRVPATRAFIFFQEFAKPTSFVAFSLEEFHSLLKVVSLQSIEFHVRRGDFETWIRHVIGDTELADAIRRISELRLRRERLRRALLDLIQKRIVKLKNVAGQLKVFRKPLSI
jgi:alpha-amylase